ncbi:hypothetical protein [Nostoc sp.]
MIFQQLAIATTIEVVCPFKCSRPIGSGMRGVRILDFRFWIKELKFNPKSKIPSGSAVTHGGNPQDRAASPKSKIELPNAQCLNILLQYLT